MSTPGGARLSRRVLTDSWRQRIALLLAIVTGAAMLRWVTGEGLVYLGLWNAFAVVYLILTAVLFATTDRAVVGGRIEDHRPVWRRWGRHGIFSVVVFATLFAVIAAGWALPQRAQLAPEAPWLLGGLAIVAVVTAWLLAHVMFAQLYARLFYTTPGAPALMFPSTDQPDYTDFAYLAFTVAMTFGTSDVSVHSSRARRAVLLHALYSFAFNAGILVLLIRFVVGG